VQDALGTSSLTCIPGHGPETVVSQAGDININWTDVSYGVCEVTEPPVSGIEIGNATLF
jgi:hypothetical protein